MADQGRRPGDVRTVLTRILAALGLAPPFLYLTWLGGWPFRLMMLGIALLGLREYLAMMRSRDRPCQETLALCWTLALFAAQARLGERGLLMVMALAPLLLILRFLGTEKIEGAMDQNARTAFGILAFVLPLAFLPQLRDLPGDQGRGGTFLILLLVWIQDSAAYFWGRALGRHKMQEFLSPRKTWEGAILGAFTAMGACWLLTEPLGLGPMSRGFATGLLLVAAAAQLGDLNESLLKRNLTVKDSGSLIPGHGGILDRFDSFTFAAPVMYYVVVAG